MNNSKITIVEVPINELRAAEYNPRKHDKEQTEQLKKSIKQFGMVDPIICNSAPERKNIIVGGHFRLEVLKELGAVTVPVIYVNIPDKEKEQALNIRLNRNVGEWDWILLAEFDEGFLADIGFNSEELDIIFPIEENPGQFDLKKELQKLDIKKISVRKGDVFELNGSKILCGDSTIEADVLKLMGNEKAGMCFTDPPYILDYLKGKKRKGKATEGFGLKRDRKYLETDTLPDDFT